VSGDVSYAACGAWQGSRTSLAHGPCPYVHAYLGSCVRGPQLVSVHEDIGAHFTGGAHKFPSHPDSSKYMHQGMHTSYVYDNIDIIDHALTIVEVIACTGPGSARTCASYP
jgi:hypothetical protein